MQLSILDIIEGERLRDQGMKTAIDHANSVDPGWSEKAYMWLLHFLEDRTDPFMTEEVRSFFVVNDYDLPPHARAFGGIIRKAAVAGLIRKVGYGTVNNPKAHRCFASKWIKA